MSFTFGPVPPQCAASLKGNEPWPQEKVLLLHHCLVPCCHPAEAHTLHLQSINKGSHQQNYDHMVPWGTSTCLLQHSNYKTRWTHLNNLVFWVDELDVRNSHANRIALGIRLLGTRTHKRSSKDCTKLPTIFLVSQVKQKCVKANLINSVVSLTLQKGISHTYQEKKIALDVILNEFILDRMWSTQHLTGEDFVCYWLF